MEDDDLDLLRSAALKSLQSKKTQNKEKVGNAIKVVESINSKPSNNVPYFAPVNHPTAGSRIQTLVNTNDNPTINDSYLAQRRDAITPWVEDFGVPYGVAAPANRIIIPNVQLSPRSAAFVSQNNDILNRRKVYGSPERDRSRSPITPPSRYTPARWSASPPPPIYKNVNQRPIYEHKIESRSPIHRSPIFRRSPLPSSKSPPKKSRSPLPSKVRKSPLRKSSSVSPHRGDRHTSPPYSRNRSPAGRHAHNQKSYRRHSPTQSRSYNRKQLNARKSLSPRNNGHHAFVRNSKSPVSNSRRSPVNISRRSRSKSPKRNFSSRSNRGDRLNKRRSPMYNRKSNRNSNRSKRKSSRSLSPSNKRKVDKSQSSHQQNNDDKKTLPMEEKSKIEKIDDTATDKPEPTKEKSTTENIENEVTASSDDDKSSDEDDGIDLFASEESESENEGRFKSNSSKNVRPNNVATVSFSKLGNAATSTLGDLNEVKSEKHSSSSHREDKYKRGSNYSNRKDDRSKKYGSSRNEESRYGDSRSSYKSRHLSSTASAIPKVVEEKKRDDKLMFKSTFQVLPNELKSEATKSTSKPTVSSRISPIKEKEKAGDKKLITLKRPAEPLADEQVEDEIENVTSTSVDNAKKSVHARLGAPTKTWKNKKSWRTEKL